MPEQIGGNKWSGKTWESYEPPSSPVPGSELLQIDTSRRYRVSDKFPYYHLLGREALSGVRGFHEHQDSSRQRLTGGEFARTTPDRVWLLQDIEEALVGSNLSNLNGHVVSTISDVGSLTGYQVARFNGNENETLFEVAPTLLEIKSFILKGEFRIEGIFQEETLLSYGDTNDGGTSIRIGLSADDELTIRLRDATGNVTEHAIPAIHIRDLDWHTVLFLVDRQKQEATIIVTNDHYESAIVETFALPANLGSFNANNSRFVIGGRQRGSAVHGNFVGEVSNVQIYTWLGAVDYNVIPLLLSGIREGCAKNITIDKHAQGDVRLNNEVAISGDEGAYTYALVNLDEGKYDIFFSQRYRPDGGSYQIYLDNIDRGGFSLYSTDNFDFTGFIDNIDFDRGFHFLKIQINPRPSTSTGDNIRLSQILFNRKDGPNRGGASSFLILGDELRKKSNEIQLLFGFRKPYGNSITHSTSLAPTGNTFAEGEIFLAGGSYKLDLTATKTADGGMIELLFNGRKVMDYDSYNATPGIYQESVQIVLPQGRNVVRLQVVGKNSSSTGYKIDVHSIRGILQSGSAFDGNTQVFATDTDFSLREGGGFGYGLYLWEGDLYGIDRWADGTNLKSEYTRWFSGGLYKASLTVRRTNLGGTQRITLENDGVTIPGITVFNEVNYQGPNQEITTFETLVKIPRGYHHVTFDNLANGVNNNNRCFNPFNALKFELLTRTPIGGDTDLRIEDEDGLVVLGKWRAGQAGRSATLNFGDVTPEKYEEVIAKINGRSSGGAMTLACQINDISSSNYKKTGSIHINGSEQNEVFTQTSELVLLSSGVITGNAQTFTSVMSLLFGVHESTGKWISHGEGSTISHVIGYEKFGWLITGENTPELRKLRFTASGNDWSDLTEIIVYGRRRKS